jgi:M6 family metalloprotease-like protein/Synergist-CTERM protein sorting domain-containing protein
MYQLVYLGDGGTADNPAFPSVPHFYQTSTNGNVMIVPAQDSLGRGPIIEVVVPDIWARSWDLYTNNTHPTRGSAAWNSFIVNEVMPRACQNFNFYEFASTTTTASNNTYATVTASDLTAALVISGYATATDQDYVWTTPNIDGTVGAPSIWGNSGSARNTNVDLYRIPEGAKSLVSPDFKVEGLGLRLNSAYVTPSAATSPSDGHFYSPRGFGVYAHEMGHSALSLSDTYDVQGYYRVQDNYPNPIDYPMRAATGNWSMMATGGYIFYTHENVPTSEFFKKYYNPLSGAEPLNFRAGLIDAYNLVNRAGAVPVDMANPSGDVLPEFDGKTVTMKRGDIYRLRTQNSNQFFYLQVRVDRDYDMATFQWGRKYARNSDKSISGGLLIMRVDTGFTNARTALSHPTVIEEAHGGIQDLRVRRIYDRSGDEAIYNFGDPGDLFGANVKDFGPYTSPSNRLFYSIGDNAALDPNRQVTNLGDAPNWHISEINYDPATETASFKVSSIIPKVVHSAVAATKVVPANLTPYLEKLGIAGLVIAPATDELYKYSVTYLDAPKSNNDPQDAESRVIVRASPGNGDAVLLGMKLKGSKKHKVMLGLSSGTLVDVEELANSIGLGFKPTVTEDYISFSTLLIPGTIPSGLASVVEVGGEPVIVIFGGEIDDEASATFYTVKKKTIIEEKCDESGCNVAYGLLAVFALLPLLAIRRHR